MQSVLRKSLNDLYHLFSSFGNYIDQKRRYLVFYTPVFSMSRKVSHWPTTLFIDMMQRLTYFQKLEEK